MSIPQNICPASRRRLRKANAYMKKELDRQYNILVKGIEEHYSYSPAGIGYTNFASMYCNIQETMHKRFQVSCSMADFCNYWNKKMNGVMDVGLSSFMMLYKIPESRIAISGSELSNCCIKKGMIYMDVGRCFVYWRNNSIFDDNLKNQLMKKVNGYLEDYLNAVVRHFRLTNCDEEYVIFPKIDKTYNTLDEIDVYEYNVLKSILYWNRGINREDVKAVLFKYSEELQLDDAIIQAILPRMIDNLFKFDRIYN